MRKDSQRPFPHRGRNAGVEEKRSLISTTTLREVATELSAEDERRTTSEIENSNGASTSNFSPPWLVGNRLRKDRSNGRPYPVTFETQKMGQMLARREQKYASKSVPRRVRKMDARLASHRSLTKSWESSMASSLVST